MSRNFIACIGVAITLLIPSIGHAALTETKLAPTRIVWLSDSTGNHIQHPEHLLGDFAGQVSTADPNNVLMRTDHDGTASILLDFGREINGGVRIYSGMRANSAPALLRVRFGESVTEAMADPADKNSNGKTAKNEHSLRDVTVHSPWLGWIRVGDTGFRFVRIDLLDPHMDYLLRYIEGVEVIDDAPVVGSFECSDPRLTEIWNTGARTVQLCMQDYLWDGIKRDRLVWLGDIHPEIVAANAVFGEHPTTYKSLDFGRKDAPLPNWMNGYSAYSLWWLIAQRDLMLHHGNMDNFNNNRDYIVGLTKQVADIVDEEGKEHLTGVRFLDWPTADNAKVIDSGLHSLIIMAMNAMHELGEMTGDAELSTEANKALSRINKTTVEDLGNSQAAALRVLAGQTDDAVNSADVIVNNGPDDFSTFYGYYMLEALAKAGKYAEAQDIMSKYWGAMLDLGATSFWEDFTYGDAAKAGRIDEIVPKGKYDIHADGGKYCYVGLRLSMCHGWAAGPTPWLTKYALGVYPVKKGSKTVVIDPKPGDLTWAKGTYPTPYGPVKVEWKKVNGKIKATYSAPKGVTVINKAK